MRIDPKRFDAAARALLCAAAVSLALLAQGCLSGAPAGGNSSAPPPQSQATPAQPPPAEAARPANAQATPAGESPLPPPRGFVNDFAEVLDAEAEGRLEERLGRLKERAKIELAVVTVETTGGQSIDDYSLALARGWGLGPPAGEEGGGVLLLLASVDRKWRIQVSRSLEADLPDEVVGEMGAGMVPSLRAGRHGEAINTCVDALVKRLAERRGFSEK